MTSPETPQGERQAVDPKMGLGEFLTTMQLLARISQKDVADGLDISQQSVSRWMRGLSTPPYDSDNASRIQHVFGLSAVELQNLVANNKPWEKPPTLKPSALAAHARRHLGATIESGVPERPYAEQMLAAFVIRAEQGPPLNEVEAELIRFLVQSEVEAAQVQE